MTRGLLAGALTLALFTPAFGQEKPAIPDQVTKQVCAGSYTYDTSNRTIQIGDKVVYTSVGSKETPDGLLLYLNLIGDKISRVVLGYAKKGTDVNRAGTYPLTPVPAAKAEDARKSVESTFAESTPVDIVQCK